MRRDVWTYRVVKKAIGTLADPDIEYRIVEHFGDNGFTADPLTVATYASYEDEPSDEKAVESLRWTLTAMLKALDHPIIEDK
jgi:hypothetical protein